MIATLGVGVGLAVLTAVSSLSTVLTYVGIAIFLSVAADPVLALAARRGLRRGVTTLLLTFAILVAFAGLAWAVIPTATAQIVPAFNGVFGFAQSLPEQDWFKWASANLPIPVKVDDLLAGAEQFLGDPERVMALGGGLLKVGTGIVDGVSGAVIVVALTIYFTVSLPRIKAKAYQFIPHSRRDNVVMLTEEILQSVGRYVGGQLTLALINAAVTFALTSIVGSPAPALLAVIAFVGALIPVIGAVLGVAIATLVTLTVNPIGALVVLIVMLVYMQFEAYFLSPRIMARAVAVPGSLVIVAALAGAALGGILGALVAVPIAAAILLIIERVVLPHLQAR